MKKLILLSVTLLLLVFANAQIVNIPDANFKAALLADTLINTNQDTEIQVSEANAYVGTIDVANENIYNLSGIESFINITGLNCRNNNLNNIDISNNTSLVLFDCLQNNISSIDVSNNTALTTFDCSGNNLSSLDFTYNIALTSLVCDSSHLFNLYVKNGNNTNITNFHAINNPNLFCIEVDDSSWATVNWTNIDLQSYFSNDCSVPSVVYIPDIYFKLSLLNHIPVIDTNGDGEIQFNEAIAFTDTIFAPSPNISDPTGIEAFINITGLQFSGNISSLDLSYNTELKYLKCNNSSLDSLNINNCTKLTYLDCCCNDLISLNLSNNTALTYLNCWANEITSLNVSNNIALTNIYCNANNIDTLDLSNNTALTDLDCYENSLYSLNVSNCTALTNLMCFENNLTSLDLSNNPLLYVIVCGSNYISSLDLSNNPVIGGIYIENNNFSDLNLKNGNNYSIYDIYAFGNPYLYCIQVDDSAYSATHWTHIDPQHYFSEYCTTDIQEQLEFSELNISPNPFTESFTIKLPENTANAEVVLYNVLGKQMEITTETTNNKITINGANLKDGVYFVELKTDKGSFTEKVVKE